MARSRLMTRIMSKYVTITYAADFFFLIRLGILISYHGHLGLPYPRPLPTQW